MCFFSLIIFVCQLQSCEAHLLVWVTVGRFNFSKHNLMIKWFRI